VNTVAIRFSTIAAVTLLGIVCGRANSAMADVKFRPPKGWTTAKAPDGTSVLVPPGVPAGTTCTVLIMGDAHGRLAEVFHDGWQRLAGQATSVRGGEAADGNSAAGYATRSTSAVLELPGQARPSYLHLFMVQDGPRVRQVAYVSDDEALFDKHLPTVKLMLDDADEIRTPKPSAAATQADARPTVPSTHPVDAAQDPGVHGVFYRAAIGFDPTGGRGQLGRNVNYLCLAADGRAYDGHPTGGPAACFEHEDSSANYGRYTLDGDDLTITWNYDRFLGRQLTQKLKRLPDGRFQDGDVAYHKLPDHDGLVLDGSYAITWGDGSKTVIRFTKDGRFTERGLRDCVNLDQLVHPDWPKLPDSGSGTYVIGRNTLEVTYDGNGPRRRMFFHTPDDPPNPKRISVASHVLERQP
jgi:hypothetical protein